MVSHSHLNGDIEEFLHKKIAFVPATGKAGYFDFSDDGIFILAFLSGSV